MKIVLNDLFDYKNRFIYQLEDGFKFSLDSILLAEYVKLKDNLKILDVCSGNCAIPLILSTKTKSKIVAFEIQNIIAKLASDSVFYNKLEDQIKVINDDINNIGNYFEKEEFDIITCNPPYFKNNGNIFNKNEFLSIARHEINVDLEKIFKISFKYLKNNGILYLVHRAERLDDIFYYSRINKINVKELQFILTKNNSIPSLVLVKCVKNSKSGIKIKKIINVSNCNTYQHLFDSE